MKGLYERQTISRGKTAKAATLPPHRIVVHSDKRAGILEVIAQHRALTDKERRALRNADYFFANEMPVLGYLQAEKHHYNGKAYMVVGSIQTDAKYRRCGVAMKLYKAAAKASKRIFGLLLASDQRRFGGSEYIWRKFVDKGLAQKIKLTSADDELDHGDDAYVMVGGRAGRVRRSPVKRGRPRIAVSIKGKYRRGVVSNYDHNAKMERVYCRVTLDDLRDDDAPRVFAAKVRS